MGGRPTSLDTLRAETFYLARLRGVDVDVGHNPSVSGVSMSSAQLASIEDVRVRPTILMTHPLSFFSQLERIISVARRSGGQGTPPSVFLSRVSAASYLCHPLCC